MLNVYPHTSPRDHCFQITDDERTHLFGSDSTSLELDTFGLTGTTRVQLLAVITQLTYKQLRLPGYSLPLSFYALGLLDVRITPDQGLYAMAFLTVLSCGLAFYARLPATKSFRAATCSMVLIVISGTVSLLWLVKRHDMVPDMDWRSDATVTAAISGLQHPIEFLATESLARFQQISNQQSQTIEEAMME